LPAVLDGAPLPEKGKKSHHSIHLRLTPRQYEVFETTLLKFGAKKLSKSRGLIDKENGSSLPMSAAEAPRLSVEWPRRARSGSRRSAFKTSGFTLSAVTPSQRRRRLLPAAQS